MLSEGCLLLLHFSKVGSCKVVHISFKFNTTSNPAGFAPHSAASVCKTWGLGTPGRCFCGIGEILSPFLFLKCFNCCACPEFISSPDWFLAIRRRTLWLMVFIQCASWYEGCKLYTLSAGGYYSREHGWQKTNRTRDKTLFPVGNAHTLQNHHV